MLQSAISGFFFLLIALFLGPALLMAGFQMLNGQKIRLPSVMKPLAKIVFDLAALLVDTANVVANMVAEQLPPKYAYLMPIAKPVVKFVIFGGIVWMVLTFLFILVDR